MVTQIHLGDIAVDVVQKGIKNIHLSVHPPTGRGRIAAPLRMNVDTIRVFAISKLGWIKKQQTKLRKQERETPREYLDRESHYCWGKRYLLKVVENDSVPRVELKHSTMVLHVRPVTFSFLAKPQCFRMAIFAFSSANRQIASVRSAWRSYSCFRPASMFWQTSRCSSSLKSTLPVLLFTSLS